MKKVFNYKFLLFIILTLLIITSLGLYLYFCRNITIQYYFTKAKKEWLEKYNFPYDEIHCVKYGTTKANCTRKIGGFQILVDDNEEVRKGWNLGDTINAKENILKEIEKLVKFA